MFRRIEILITILLLNYYTVTGQKTPSFTQYTYNTEIINPAFTGTRGNLQLGLGLQKRFSGIEGSPETGFFSVHSPLKNSLGLGFGILYNKRGPLQITNPFVNTAYRIQTSRDGNLSFGIKTGLTFNSLNTSKLVFDEFETISSDNIKNNIGLNFSSGLYYYTKDTEISLAFVDLILNDRVENESGLIFTFRQKVILNNSLKLKPSTLIRYDKSNSFLIDLSLNLIYDNDFDIGLSYRLKESIDFFFGFKVNDLLRLSYNYGLGVSSSLTSQSNGTHGVSILLDVNRVYKYLR
ncbi:PorP/SprF family type IX secretion system membrane protein [Wenyingzhuangia sp. IMCC45533]